MAQTTIWSSSWKLFTKVWISNIVPNFLSLNIRVGWGVARSLPHTSTVVRAIDAVCQASDTAATLMGNLVIDNLFSLIANIAKTRTFLGSFEGPVVYLSSFLLQLLPIH